jgi:glycerate kinase
MKIVIAPDKFKGTFSAVEVAAAIAGGLHTALPDAEILTRPMADGGEGTVAALANRRGTRLTSRRVTGPLPEHQVDASIALLPDGTAVIESAAASGLWLLPEGDRDPLATTTFGTGQLIAAAVTAGARRIVLGLGGTATVDGGLGALQACGFSILTTDGEPLSPTEPLCGRDIGRVLAVKHGRGEITAGIEIVGACDVLVPLLGPAGSARMFGPQKGAGPEGVDQLERDLTRLVDRTGTAPSAALPGAGAAGGLGFAITAFFRGSLRSGFDVVAEAVDLASALERADLCVTGEGRLDRQSRHGKVTGGVARMCRDRGVACVAVVGSAEPDARVDGIGAVFTLGHGQDIDAITAAAADAGRWFARQR